MGVQPIAFRRPDCFGHSCANVVDLELTLKQCEHAIRGQQAADTRHLTHLDCLIQQHSSRTVLRRAEDANDFSPKALEVG
jgi:hypothetical protein